MRRFVVLLLLLPAASRAQNAGERELTAQVGWQYGGTQEYTGAYVGYPPGDFHAQAAVNYGGAMTFYIRDYEGVEIAYSYQATDLILRPAGQADLKLADMTSQYIHLNGLLLHPLQPHRTDAFILAGVGATVFQISSGIKAPGYSSEAYDAQWLFSVGLGGGLMAHLNERISLRLQTRLLVPIRFSSSAFYFGGGGASVTAGGGTAIAQGDVSLGLSLKLGTR